MFWFVSRLKRFDSFSIRIFERMGVAFKKLKQGQFSVKFTELGSYAVCIHYRETEIHFVGYPGIEFDPKRFPLKLLAQLLVRNGQLQNGAWQLVADDRSVICRFCYVVPFACYSFARSKQAMEITLEEICFARRRYEMFESI